MKKRLISGAVLGLWALVLGLPLWAEPEEPEPASRGAVSKREIALTASTLPEAKIAFNQNFTLPFLQGEHFLTRDNSLRTRLGAELTPVSLNGLADVYWTPAAFFQGFSILPLPSGLARPCWSSFGPGGIMRTGTGKTRPAIFTGPGFLTGTSPSGWNFTGPRRY